MYAREIMTTGRKQELVNRIADEAGYDGAAGHGLSEPLDVLQSVEHVLSVHYRRVPGAGDLACKFRELCGMDINGNISGVGGSRDVSGQDGAQPSTRAEAVVVNCICKNKGTMPGMLRCTDCGKSQHASCVVGERAGEIDEATYLCETCRFALADPFVRVREELVPMAKMREIPGMPPIMDSKGMYHARIKLEQQFYVTQQQLAECNAKMSRTRVLITCLQLEDEIPCRMHWPKNVQMRVNNMSIKPYARGVGSEMGINQRDNVVDITRMLCQGRNSVTVMAVHSGTWVLRIVIADRLGLEDIKPKMMREETLEEARSRMASLLAGRDGVDDDLGLEQVNFSLKDPLTCMRMVVPARFEGASGTQAFDLDSFLSMTEVNRKWQDPTTLKNSTVKQMRVDSYVREVSKYTHDMPSLTNFEVNAEGDWRPEGYTDGWFDIRAMDEAALAKLTAWARSHGDEDSHGEDETLDYQVVRDEGIDVRNEVNEATSALLSAGKHVPSSAVANGIPIANGNATNTTNVSFTSGKSVNNSAGQARTSIPLKVTGTKRPAVEVIDLCDSD